jgi:hypothetical protein
MRRLLILFAAIGLLAAGCGGGGGGGSSSNASGPPLTKSQYQAKLHQISSEISKSVGATTSSGEIRDQDVGKLQRAFHQFADRLREVNPPAEVKSLHDRLANALDDLGDAFPALAKKLNAAKNDPEGAVKALFGAKPIQELIKLGQEFKAKGYNLNLNG